MIRKARFALLLTCLIPASGCGDRERVQASAASSPTDNGHPTSESPVPAALDSAARPVNAVDVVRLYYDAIMKRHYDTAYALWGQSGKASGQTRAAFAAGFAQTASVRATIGDSVRLEGAAGSQYATVPVTVDAELRDGTRQHFEGFYTLRRAMVDGATPEQRRWRIYSAHLR